MKLNMWMIANRLYGMEMQVHIYGSDPVKLKSARRVYATDCVYVYGSGNDTICQADSGKIVMKDVNVAQGFEIVQDVFDYYEDWHCTVLELAQEGKYQEIIDRCRQIFHNPLVLQDGSGGVLGIACGSDDSDLEDEVDSEWTYMIKFGHASVDSIRYMRKAFPDRNFGLESIQKFQMDSKRMRNKGVSYGIRLSGRLVGRFVLLEKEREINEGDFELIKKMADIVLNSLKNGGTESEKILGSAVYEQLLDGKDVHQELLERQLDCNEWDEQDLYQIVIIRPTMEIMTEQILDLTDITLKIVFSKNIILRKDQEFVMIVNETKNGRFKSDSMKGFFKKGDMIISKSLHLFGIRSISYLYSQAKFAIEINKWKKQFSESRDVIDFYFYARDFIIMSGNMEEIRMACHPDIMMLWDREKNRGDDLFDTFAAYIANNCSIKNTADAIFIHRNTLMYRIQKVLKIIQEDIEDIYTRNYMMLSIDVLKLYDTKSSSES